MPEYDVIVIGGGSAGTSAAAGAARAGARTLMINDGELGGLCILRGCMPTKAMLASTHALHETTHLDRFGLRLEGRVVPEFDRIMQRKDALVRRFQRAKIQSIEAGEYDVLDARARFVAGGDIDAGGQRLRARSYVITTGSVATSLAIPGIDEVPVVHSDDVMRMEAAPESLLVQGAGPIALELAQFFARIGTRVMLVNRSPLLSRTDSECGEELTKALTHEPNLELSAPGRILRLRKAGDGLAATIESDGRSFDYPADMLLMATGRRAALDDLGLEHTGLEPRNGRLEHDASMRSGNPRIWVAGDATGAYQVLHLANQEGTVAGHNAADGTHLKRMSYRLKMAVIFTDPPYATVGLTQVESAEQGLDPVVGRARFPETGRAITMDTRHGLWKVLVRRDDGAILGSSIVGPRADDLIHLISMTMYYGGNVEQLCELPWYHPTLSEVLLSIGRDVASQLRVSCTIPGAATLPPGYTAAPPRKRSD